MLIGYDLYTLMSYDLYILMSYDLYILMSYDLYVCRYIVGFSSGPISVLSVFYH